VGRGLRGGGLGLVVGAWRVIRRPEAERFFQVVMTDLGYDGWSLRWTESDAFCWRSEKRIDICPMGDLDECKQMLLHEIAHIEIVERLGSQHTLRFWQRLRELTKKYLDSDLSEYQREMAFTYCPEFDITKG
jgi:hypothetical protein